MLKEISSKVTEYANMHGLKEVTNDYGEIRRTNGKSIIFENGWVASIVKNIRHTELNANYSVATCDYNGYFNWDVLNEHGAIDGCFYCNTDDEIINACEIIRNLPCNK